MGIASPNPRYGKHATPYIRELENERKKLAGLLTEVARSGVSFEDERLPYVEIQIDRETWDALQALNGSELRNE